MVEDSAVRLDSAEEFLDLTRVDFKKVGQHPDNGACRQRSAGGIRKRSIFHHPHYERVDQEYELPETVLRFPSIDLPKDQEFALEVFVGIRDGGAFMRTPEFPVRFLIRANNTVLLDTKHYEKAWRQYVLPLDKKIPPGLELEFVTQAIGTPDTAWAAWGEPRILRMTASG